MIDFAASVKGIHLNPNRTSEERSSLPAWRWLGPLAVDSLVFVDHVEATAVTEVDTGLVRIYSGTLLQVFNKIGAIRLVKSFPHHVAGDTLYWDSIRGVWHDLPDLSVFYTIFFDKTREVHEAVELLRTESRLQTVSGVERPSTDSAGIDVSRGRLD